MMTPHRAGTMRRFVGAHVSAAGGIANAVANAEAIGARAFALFLKSQRKWAFKPIDVDDVTEFRAELLRAKIAPGHVLPHGSYLVNLASADEEKRARSLDTWLDDIRRCRQLALTRYNFRASSA